MVVVAFGQILPSDFFEFPNHGTLNVHASLLPKYRGAAPITHAILNGEKQTGVTIMRIDEGMDTGDILTQRATSISDTCTTGELEELLAVEGAALLMETIGGYLKGEIRPIPQDSKGVSYAPLIKKEDGEVSWNNDAVSIHNRVRAMNPWPIAFSRFRDQKLKIWKTEVLEAPPESSSSSKKGTIVEAEKGSLVVQCAGRTYLRLLTLQLPNRKKVSAGDFINGTLVKAGECLG
jgi:methionyl-tRNA formyltransferase